MIKNIIGQMYNSHKSRQAALFFKKDKVNVLKDGEKEGKTWKQ